MLHQAASRVVAPVIVLGYAAATAPATAILAGAPPLLAEVGTRLNGDGTGLIIGVNIPILGWVLLSVCDLVWALFATSVKDSDILLNIDGVSSPCG